MKAPSEPDEIKKIEAELEVMKKTFSWTAWMYNPGVIIISLLLTLMFGIILFRNISFQLYAIPATATVVGNSEEPGLDRGSVNYWPIVTFRTQRGDSIVTKMREGSGEEPKYEPGDTIEIFYYAEEPSTVDTGVTAVGTSVVAVIVVMMSSLFFFSLRGYIRKKMGGRKRFVAIPVNEDETAQPTTNNEQPTTHS